MELKSRIRIIQADITGLNCDAIVNGANSALLPGGGVDGAIRRKAGKELNDELYRIGRCPAGNAVITPGYGLPARRVIHTVAPIWNRHDSDQEAVLASCYDSVLELADQYQLRSIAFPAIGTGAYGWPSDTAAAIAFGRVTAHLSACTIQDLVIFCCFTAGDVAAYAQLYGQSSGA
ncbi:MAG: macro domain-containing protein [Alphaproteobacteria bacterium]|nr:macro domain-containing protein [Alphaproteobacteria bacterium]